MSTLITLLLSGVPLALRLALPWMLRREMRVNGDRHDEAVSSTFQLRQPKEKGAADAAPVDLAPHGGGSGLHTVLFCTP